MADIASLGIKIDSSDAVNAAADLDKLATSGRRVQTELNTFKRRSDSAAASLEKVGRAGVDAAGGIRRAEAASARARREMLGLDRASNAAALSIRRFVAAYLTIRTAQAVITGIIKTRVELDRMRNTLTQGVGAERLAEELNFVRDMADRFGLSLLQTAESYAKFTAASRGTALEGEKARKIFVGISTASAALGLSAANVAGAFRAIEQMISKGTVQSEELRGQLGERLPGAYLRAARAMGVTTQELSKMLELGQVLSEDFLPKFADQLVREFAGGAERASTSAVASVNRLSTAWLELKRLAAESPFGDAVFSGINTLTRYFENLANSLEAVKLGMLDLNGFSTSDLGGREVQDLVGALRRDPGSIGEARLRREDGTDPTGALAAEKALRAQEKAAEDARKAWDALLKTHETSKEKIGRLADEFRKVGKAAGLAPKDIEKQIAERLTPAGDLRKQVAEAAALRREQLNSALADIRRDLESIVSDYENAETLLEAERNAGLVNEENYYKERRRFIELTAQKRAESIRAEVDALSAQRLSGDEAIANQRKIADLEAELSRVRKKAIAEVRTLGVEQESAAKRVEAANQQALMAAQEYLRMLELQQQRELDAFGMGEQERRRVAGLAQIDDRYSQQIADLSRERAAAQTDEQRRQLDEQLRITRDFHQRAIESYDDYWDRLLQKQQDASVGLNEAIANYLDESANVAKQTADAFDTAFQGLEDAIVNTVRTGKLEFRALADSVLAEVARMMAKRGLSALLNGLLGSFGGGNAAIAAQVFAKGGIFNKPTAFRFANGAGFSTGIMGEAGPEAVVPLKRGKDGKLGIAGGGQTIINAPLTINESQMQINPRELQRIHRQSIKGAIAESRVRNSG